MHDIPKGEMLDVVTHIEISQRLELIRANGKSKLISEGYHEFLAASATWLLFSTSQKKLNGLDVKKQKDISTSFISRL